ncbi:MAG: hypothetical protein ACKOOC_02410, partial [Cyanobium sp.]
VLARVGHAARAESLLHQAKVSGKGQAVGMASLWGLTAIVLGHRDMAAHFFRMALQKRCYQAPYLVRSPLLAPYGQEDVVAEFMNQMAEHFPGIGNSSLELTVAQGPRPTTTPLGIRHAEAG